MDWSYLFTSFQGRIPRHPFWIALVTLVAAEIIVHMLALRMAGERMSSIVDLAFTYPEFALFAKRGFDRNLPLWLTGAFFAISVFINFLVIVGLGGSMDKPSTLVLVIMVPWTVYALALLVELGFRPGTRGPNRFGPDPLAGGV
jgi:uncharacterized membrane protein YhaH (DUF805 family)